MTKQTGTYNNTSEAQSIEGSVPKKKRKKTFSSVYNRLKKKGEIDIDAFVEKANKLRLNPVKTKGDKRWARARVRWTEERVQEEIRLIEEANTENYAVEIFDKATSSKPEGYTFKPAKLKVTTGNGSKGLRYVSPTLTVPGKPKAPEAKPISVSSPKPTETMKPSKIGVRYVPPKLTAPSRRINVDDLTYVPPELRVPSTPSKPPVPPVPPVPPTKPALASERTVSPTPVSEKTPEPTPMPIPIPVSEKPTSEKKEPKIKDRIKGEKGMVRKNLRKLIQGFLIVGGVLAGVVGSYFHGFKSAQNDSQGKTDKSPEIVKVEEGKKSPAPYKIYEAQTTDISSNRTTTIDIGKINNGTEIHITNNNIVPSAAKDGEVRDADTQASEERVGLGDNVRKVEERYHDHSNSATGTDSSMGKVKLKGEEGTAFVNSRVRNGNVSFSIRAKKGRGY